MSDPLVPLLIALGDDELVLGHRHSEWTGWAPHIEEDVAFSSIAQDEIGHAAALYLLAGEITGQDADEIAFGRQPDEYRNALLCERPNGDWAFTLVRHWLYDHADDLRLEALEGSAHTNLAGLATKMRREERYHLLHADMWMTRLARGPIESRTRLIEAIAQALPDALGLFEPLPEEDAIVDAGLMSTHSRDLQAAYSSWIDSALDTLGLPAGPAPEHAAEFVASSSGDLIEGDDDGTSGTVARVGMGGRAGTHTEEFRNLWEVMTTHQRETPGARW